MQLVVKSQILAGGRGLGTFKSGLKGGVHIVKKDQVEDLAGNACLLFYSSNLKFPCYHFMSLPLPFNAKLFTITYHAHMY